MNYNFLLKYNIERGKNLDVFFLVKKKMILLVRKCFLKKIKFKVDFYKNRK